MTEPVVIEFIASANFSELTAQMKAAEVQAASFQKSLTSSMLGNRLAGAMADYKQSMSMQGQYITNSVTMTTSTDKFTSALNRNKLTMAQTKAAMAEYRNEATRATSQVARLGTQQELLNRSILVTAERNAAGGLTGVISTPTGLSQKEMLSSTIKHQTEMNTLSRLQGQYNQKLIDMGKNAQWSGRQMMIGLTLPITLFGAAAAKSFYTVDQQLTKMVKVYGDLNTQLSGDQITQLRGQVLGLAKDLAGAWGASSQVTLGIAGDMAAIGKTGADLIASTRETVRLSVLGDVDQTASMKTVLSMQSAFKISTEELANSVNFLNAVENQTSLSLKDFTDALPIAGPAVHALGGDIKELALMLVSMREGGIGATQAANALKSSLGRLIAPTPVAVKYLKNLGVDLKGIVDKTQGDPVTTIRELSKEMTNFTKLQKVTAMKDIFGLQQYSKMLALFENINNGSQAKQVEALSGASNGQLSQIAQQEIDRVANSASGQFSRAVESAKLAFVGVGETFLNLGTKALGIFVKIGKLFDALPDPFKNVIVAGAILVAAFGPAKMLWGIMQNMVGSVKQLFKLGQDKMLKRDPDKELLDQQIQAEKLASERIDKSMYDHAKATEVWDTSLNQLLISLAKINETMTTGVVSRPNSTTAIGRAEIANMMQVRASGHTILPGSVEAALFGGQLQTPSRTIPQNHEINQAQRNAMGSFYGSSAGIAKVDPQAFAIGAAQSAAFEEGMKNPGHPAADQVKEMIARIRSAQGNFDAQLVLDLNAFYAQYQGFFDTVEAQTQRSASFIMEKIAGMEGLDSVQSSERLDAALQNLGSSLKIFDEKMAGRAYDARSLAAQFETDAMLLGGVAPKHLSGDRSVTDRPYDRVGQLSGGMAAAGVPISYATLDAGSNFGTIITTAATDAAATTTAAAQKVAEEEISVLTPTLDAAKLNLAAAEQATLAAKEQLAASKQSVLSATTWTEKFLTRGMEQNAKNMVTSAQAAEEAARIEVAAAEKFSGIVVSSAVKVESINVESEMKAASIRAVQTPFASGAASSSSKIPAMLRGNSGKVSGGLMGLSMLSYMIPDTGNSSIDNGKSILGGVGMGAGAGMMIGPEGAAIGAVIGGLVTALPILISKLNEAGDAMKASFTAGETTATAFGKKLTSITDISMVDVVKGSEQIQTSFDQFLKGFQGAAKDSNDKKFIDALIGASPEDIAKLIKNRVTAGFAAGLNSDELKAEILAALAASGNNGQLGLLDSILGKNGSVDPKKLVQDQINSTSADVAQARSDALTYMPGKLSISMAAGQPGSVEWNKETQAIKDQQDAYLKTGDVVDSLVEKFSPLGDSLVGLATSMKAIDFNKFIQGENLSGISADTFNAYVKKIPGITGDVTNALDALTAHGATTSQMLEAINLKAQGVISTWGELSTMAPAQLDVLFAINKTQTGITNAEVAPLLKIARDRLSKAGQAGLWDAKTINKASKNLQDKLAADKKAITSRYDAEIAALKKVEAARQAAVDAEAKRLQREKEMRNFAISYREAIANGNMAQAAQIQNNMQSSQAQWKADDKTAAAKDKAQAAIDKLTAARDKEVAAIEAAAAVDTKATQTKLDNLDKHNAAITKQNASQVAAAQATVDTLISLQNKPWSKDVQDTLNQLAGTLGTNVGSTEKAAFIAAAGDSGTEIWRKISGDLSKAPWDLIGKLVNDKINGTAADVKVDLALLNKWVPTPSNIHTGGLGGSRVAMASMGGSIRGAGTATSDSIPARLSNGEFVIRASSVNKYGAGLLHAINSGNFANGGLVGTIGDSLAKTSLIDAVYALTNGLFNPGTDIGRTGTSGGGSAAVVGSGLGAIIAQFAEKYVGVPYSRTSADPTHGWGCATMVSWMYDHFGIGLPSKTLSNDQYNGLKTSVSPKDIQAGDLLFYHYANGVNVKNRVNHVGMALNPNSQIEAANPKAGTRISGIDWGNFIGAKRVINPLTGSAFKDGGMMLLAQGGEFMMNRDAVSAYGSDMMNAMNNRTYHTGGLVTAGGPKLDKFASGGSSEYNFNIYGAPGMDVDELANAVVAKLETVERRKGIDR